MKKLVIAMAALACVTAFAAGIDCYRNPRTDAMTCVDLDNVRERDGIRISPIYQGGPNGVRRTSFTMHANCKTGVTHLKDRDGVSFAGGHGNETDVVISLRGGMCGAYLRK